MKFKEGDKVMAKWPGTQLYFHATVKKYDEEEGYAEVLFEDGTEMDVPSDYVKNEVAFRQKKRSKSPSRRRSRSKSPARSPSRQTRKKDTSPSRRARQPRKKSSTTSSSSSEDPKSPSSPSRMTITKSQRFDKTDRESKEGYEKNTDMKKYTKKQVRNVSTDSTEVSVKAAADLESGMSIRGAARKTQVSTRSYQAKIVLEKVSDDSAPVAPKLHTTNSCIAEARQTIANVKKSMKKRHEYEFGGPFGVLFHYLVVPALVIAIVTCYGKRKAELLKFSLKDISLDWKSYYDETALTIVAGFLLFHAMLYALPFGYIMEGPKTYSGRKTEYRISAFHCLIISIMVCCGLQYYRLPVSIVYDKMLPICATCILLSFVFNILLQFKSYLAEDDELNPRGNTGCTIYDMFVGRELHPKFGRYYHLKLLLYRPCMTAWMLVNLVYIQKELAVNNTIRPAVGILAGVQILYCVLAFFWDETQAVYAFDIKNEALGFLNLIGNLAIVPFVYTCPVRYLIDHPKSPPIPLPLLVTATMLLAIGLALVILSGYQKTAFRQNPYDPSLSALDSIPPSKKGGIRLITSGYWGFVRHPNYLGEILLGLGNGLLCGFSDVMAWIFVLFVTGLLIHRSLRLEERSREAHGYAWTEYCKRVRYRIFPYVF